MESAFHLMHVEIYSFGIMGDGVAVADDEVVGGLETLEETCFAACVDDLCACVGSCFMPYSAFEVM